MAGNRRMTVLDEKTAKTLLVMARTLFPYDYLDDSYYVVIIDSINRNIDNKRLEFIRSGAAALSNESAKEFYELPEDKRIELLKQIEHTPFFKEVHGTTVRELFNNPAIWSHFDYEGPSASKGGFLKRGFDQKFWTTDD
jgi:hypothetical protein